MNHTRKISFAAVICGLSTLFLYLSSVLPSGQIAVFAAATALFCCVIMECGVKYGFLSFVCTGLLSLILIPNKLILIPYVVILGYYPVLKLYIERIHNLFVEWCVKLSSGLISAFISLGILRLILPNFTLPFPVYVLILGVLAVFAIYDIALSLFVKFYTERISRYIHRK